LQEREKLLLLKALTLINCLQIKCLSKAKVLEEVDELIEAIEEDTNKIHEAADVFYHLLMYLEANDVKIEEVMQELENRKK
tara:strand:- start:3 stop:245 length:243 start_codon:yes stop_codon:yes gene_type:complete